MTKHLLIGFEGGAVFAGEGDNNNLGTDQEYDIAQSHGHDREGVIQKSLLSLDRRERESISPFLRVVVVVGWTDGKNRARCQFSNRSSILLLSNIQRERERVNGSSSNQTLANVALIINDDCVCCCTILSPILPPSISTHRASSSYFPMPGLMVDTLSLPLVLLLLLPGRLATVCDHFISTAIVARYLVSSSPYFSRTVTDSLADSNLHLAWDGWLRLTPSSSSRG